MASFPPTASAELRRLQAGVRAALHRCPKWIPCSVSSPRISRRRSRIIKTFAPLVAPVKIGRSSPVDLEHLAHVVRDLKRRFDMAAAEGGHKLPPELRKRP